MLVREDCIVGVIKEVSVKEKEGVNRYFWYVFNFLESRFTF